MTKWQRFKFHPCLPLGKDSKRATGSAEHIALSRTAAGEGMVLLKNDGILPLSRRSRVALFGKASADYVKGGGGSGDVTVEYVRNLCDGMEEKQAENKIVVFDRLCSFYRENVAQQYKEWKRPGQTDEPELPADLLNDACAFADTAIISICRYSTEGSDRKEADDFYLTDAEKAMVEAVKSKFDNIVVVLNVGGMVDTSWFINEPKIKGVLLGWQAGMVGAMAQADILCGDVCPSGRLSDTLVAKFSDYPSSENFNESEEYVEYTDDIYVGYRYFETVADAIDRVNYPFGFGLSYTTFDIETVSAKEENGVITVNVKVTNTGSVAGKEVVQVYTSAPQGVLGKPARELRAFAKTDLLVPGESRVLTLSFNVNDMASYDEGKAAYVLEEGAYYVLVGKNVRDCDKVFTYNVLEDTVTLQLENRCVPRKLSKRMKSDGSYEALPVSEYDEVYDTSDWPEKPTWKFDHIQGDMRNIKTPEDRIMLDAVVDGKASMEEFIAQMSELDLIDLIGGRPNDGVADTFGIGDLDTFGIPSIMTADGPAGLRIQPHKGVKTTAWPCATLLACSWNTDIVYEVGRAGALEVKENNIGMWLTPALNIHRSSLCGRNFEYFSEDPLISGKMAAAMVNGIQSQNIAACVKHFCCNNKEVNRKYSDSRVSERALREIYLKGFEIAVKESSPWGLMTAYNIVNGTYPSESSDLLKGILRDEWDYDGLVTTDWDNAAEHYREVLAGNNLRMPTGSSRRLLKALELGLITRADLEENAKRILQYIIRMAYI